MILRTVVNYVSLIVFVITRVPSIPKDRRMKAKLIKSGVFDIQERISVS